MGGVSAHVVPTWLHNNLRGSDPDNGCSMWALLDLLASVGRQVVRLWKRTEGAMGRPALFSKSLWRYHVCQGSRDAD